MIRYSNIKELMSYIDVNSDEYICLQISPNQVAITEEAVRRMKNVAESTGAAMVYSYFRYVLENGERENAPLIPYQTGSVRNDFDFGGLVVIDRQRLLRAFDEIDHTETYADGGWYAMRLALSEMGEFRLIPEYLYELDKTDFRNSGEKQHDYVNPAAGEYQLSMEKVFTEYLKRSGGLISKPGKEVNFEPKAFKNICSVIIPVKNRAKTIKDAVKSALSQECDFPFNVIVIDNDSTDGTESILSSIEDSRLKVIHVDSAENLGIGGCWNRGIEEEECGMFVVQLDSDDIYSSSKTLQTIVDKFYSTRAAMVIGSYTLTDFDMNILPPGLIDHKEWTAENGPNNALRINGLGAPRAFYTPLLRKVRFPNVSYGEDYAVALRISGEWKVGRIYDSLYLCRRWGGNSDASLDANKVNEHNYYKDFIRSCELQYRRRKSQKEGN